MTALPLVDLGLTGPKGLRTGASASPVETARALDRALHETGFLLVRGHGIPPALLDAARAAALDFFHLPAIRKAETATTADSYRGWVRPGAESNASAYGRPGGPVDLKESFVFGPPAPDDEDYRAAGARWFSPNRLPAAVPGLGATFCQLFSAMERLALHLLTLAETAVAVAPGTFTGECRNGMSTLAANWYPPGNGIAAQEEQYRVGPHTDYGGMTVLDRQPGLGGLQIQTLDDEWVDAPYVPGALTINTGDLISHWSAGRWRSTRHRVLAPPPEAPSEELLSLVFFHDPDYDAVVTPLGDTVTTPVLAGDYLAAKLDALAGGRPTGTELVGALA